MTKRLSLPKRPPNFNDTAHWRIEPGFEPTTSLSPNWLPGVPPTSRPHRLKPWRTARTSTPGGGRPSSAWSEPGPSSLPRKTRLKTGLTGLIEPASLSYYEDCTLGQLYAFATKISQVVLKFLRLCPQNPNILLLLNPCEESLLSKFTSQVSSKI